MMRTRFWAGPLVAALAAFLFLEAGDTTAVNRILLERHRNLGKAFYETPTMESKAVEEFRKALELAPNSARERLNYGLALLKAGKPKEGVAELEKVQKLDPELPHTWFNLGVAYKRDGEYDRAVKQFEQMIRLVPGEAVAHYNLGVLHKMQERLDAAIPYFEKAAALDPNLAAPHFQLFNAYRQVERSEDAARELRIFQAIKKRQEGTPTPEDMDWCVYAEILDVVDTALAAEPAKPADLRFEVRKLDGRADPVTAGLLVFDLTGDGRPSLLAWSAKGVALFRYGTEPVAGLEGVDGAAAAAAADANNDGFTDLCLVTDNAALLYLNQKGTLRLQSPPLAAGRFSQPLWLDYDHDNDLDLFLFGAKPVLLENRGQAGFGDVTQSFPFVPGEALGGAAFRLAADGKGVDLAVAYRDRGGVLYRDRLGGKYETVPLESLPAGASGLTAYDADNNGELDLAFLGGRELRLLLNRRGVLEAGPWAGSATGGFVFADLENRSAGDLVSTAGIQRNAGGGNFSPARTPAGLPGAAAWAEADFDLDGRTDLAAVAPSGELLLLRNTTALTSNWVRVKIAGIKNPKTGFGSEVEIKAGGRYQKRIYRGMPILAGIGSFKEADVLRITWPNGLMQSETNLASGKLAAYQEAERLSGSCPMVFSWNGSEFQFLGDILGVAPLGASAGEGRYFPVDHDEYLRIPAGAMALRDGRYEIRVTEELREVSYLDQIRLVALDHPAGTEIYSNDRFKSPPYEDLRLYGVTRRIRPVAARDERGRTVLADVRAADRRYAGGFRRTRAGVAELHALELDFPAGTASSGNAVLILTGWTDWADGSTFRAASQEMPGGLVMPYLQVKDARGAWRTVLPDMGMPSGIAKTIAVDLSGKWLSASRSVRIVTNMCVYWDEVFLSEETAPPRVRRTDLDAEAAVLDFRGFSRQVVQPSRRQPEWFDYARVEPATMWNPARGLYTRFGDVRELLREADDRLVVMAAGDELRLIFDPRALPPLAPGWRRDFLLFADGWSKDGDLNTAHAETVEPLPFHGMSSYPYPPGENYPDDAAHKEYRLRWNTRPGARLIQPLAR